MEEIVFKRPDLHLHSLFSDGSETPEELLESVKRAGIDVFALTDHDCIVGCDEVRKCLGDNDSPYFIGGVELSCKDSEGKYHILGYCYDVDKPAVRNAVALTHKARMEKAQNRVDYLRNTYGFTFSDEDTKNLLAMKNPGKPHFAALMIKYGYVANKSEAFEILGKYKGKELCLSPLEAIDAILKADGIPVLAHGILGDGSQKLTKEEIEARVKRLKQAGLMGLECYYSGYSEEQKKIMLDLAEKYNLLVTAGSDYHGKNKPVIIGDTNNPDPDKMKRFYVAVQKLLEER